eukprot:803725-Pyramimonas_sp.AAC.2
MGWFRELVVEEEEDWHGVVQRGVVVAELLEEVAVVHAVLSAGQSVSRSTSALRFPTAAYPTMVRFRPRIRTAHADQT